MTLGDIRAAVISRCPGVSGVYGVSVAPYECIIRVETLPGSDVTRESVEQVLRDMMPVIVAWTLEMTIAEEPW